MRRYRRLARYSFRQWRSLLLILAATVAFSATTALQPLPMKLLVDVALEDASAPGWLRSVLGSISAEPTAATVVVVAAAASLLLFVLNSVFTVAITWGWTSAGQRMVYDLAGDLFAKLQRLSLRFHAGHGVGESLSRLTGDTYAVYTLTEALLVSPVQQVLTLATVGWAAWVLDPQLAILTLAAGPIMAVSARFFGGVLQRRARADREAQTEVLAFVHETASTLPLVRAFGTENHNTTRFRQLAGSAVRAAQGSLLSQVGFSQVNAVISGVGAGLVTFVGAQRALDGSLTVGTLVVFLTYLRTVQNRSQSLLDTYGHLRTASAGVDRVLEVLDADDEVVESPNARALVGRTTGHVRIDGVTFGYEPGRAVIRDVDLEAAPGEVVALIGATGAGKSTITSLIPRLFDPWSGRVTLDGVDLRDMTLASLRSQVAVVLQEPLLLPLSVADNIAYGRPGASWREIHAAAIAAQADGFIRRMPAGYDTVLGERGATLSGGERQRISIARALLKDAPVLILDEPTSSLDASTEETLLEALRRLMLGRTTFIIAHRLSTVQQADRIAVVADGEVVELGSHEELMALGGRYARMRLLQTGRLTSELLA